MRCGINVYFEDLRSDVQKNINLALGRPEDSQDDFLIGTISEDDLEVNSIGSRTGK